MVFFHSILHVQSLDSFTYPFHPIYLPLLHLLMAKITYTVPENTAFLLF